MIKRLLMTGITLLSLYPLRASASIMGEENMTLLSILQQSVKQTLAIKDTLVSLRETAQAANETARATQHAVEATPRIKALLDDPKKFFADSERAWGATFPRVGAFHRSSSKSSGSVKKLTGLDLHYDEASGSVIRHTQDLAQDAGNVFEQWTRKVDTWGFSDAHDEIMSLLEKHHRMALSNFADLATSVDLSLLTPMGAAVHSARAAAIEAIAVVESTGALHDLARNDKIRFMREVQEETTRRIEHAQEVAQGLASVAHHWDMRPALSPEVSRTLSIETSESAP